MYQVAGKTMDSIYHRIIYDIRELGIRQTPRGKTCIEIRPAAITIRDAKFSLYSGRSRKLNYKFWAVETLCYIAGWGENLEHAPLMIATNKNMAAFINSTTGKFDGAYGPRLDRSLEYVYQLLLHDPSTRQAVASIWDSTTLRDFNGSKDVPCTTMLHFMSGPVVEYSYLQHDEGTPYARQGETGRQLDLTVYMRSNDANWGLPYDVPAFACIQACMAACLGMKVGKYTHLDGSLHYYEDVPGQTEKPPTIVHPNDEQWIPNVARIPQWDDIQSTWVTVKSLCNLYLHELYQWLVDFQRPASEWHHTYDDKYLFFDEMSRLIRFQHAR